MTTHRRSIRLPSYDYASASAYFVTICAYQRRCLFEERAVAALITRCWREIPSHFPSALADEFVVMPNHVHGIVFIDEPVRAQHAAPLRRLGVEAGSLGAIVRSFKAAVTREVRLTSAVARQVWQRNYYERVIRDETELLRVREYIQNNPLQWQLDHENPERTANGKHDSD